MQRHRHRLLHLAVEKPLVRPENEKPPVGGFFFGSNQVAMTREPLNDTKALFADRKRTNARPAGAENSVTYGGRQWR